MLNVGTKAPNFKLYSTPDQELGLSELRGKKVVILFYPADWSPVCSDQLSLVNQSLKMFEKDNTIAIGISVDSKWSHLAFSKQSGFCFPLLADFEPKGEVSKLYEVYDEETGHSNRAAYIVDEDGVIQYSQLYPTGLNPGVDGILDALDNIKK